MIQMYLVFFSDVQKFNAYMHLQNNDKSVKPRKTFYKIFRKH